MRLRGVATRPELDAPTSQPHDLVEKQSAPTSDRTSESNGESQKAILEASSNKGGKPTNTQATGSPSFFNYYRIKRRCPRSKGR